MDSKNFVIFDLDGTLALTEHRSHFVTGEKKDWRSFFAACVDDLPNPPVIAAMRAHSFAGHDIVIVSGRSDEVSEQTAKWINDHIVPNIRGGHPIDLIMRKEGDFMPDHELKAKWLNNGAIPPKHQILCVYDDRDAVVAMWREQGVPCFQVAPGNF